MGPEKGRVDPEFTLNQGPGKRCLCRGQPSPPPVSPVEVQVAKEAGIRGLLGEWGLLSRG